jgi:hypothetical protein
MGKIECGQDLRIAFGFGAGDLARRDGKTERSQIDAIKTLRVIDQRRVATPAHVGDDVANRGVDVFRNFPLRGEKIGKALAEIAHGCVEPQRHFVQALSIC